MTDRTIRIDAENSDLGLRVDAFLSRKLEEISRSAVQRLIEQQNVRINGRPARKNDRLSGGDLVQVTLPEPRRYDEAAPQQIPLSIAYEDGDLLVVDKPKGMVVHPAAGNPDGTLVNALLYHCGGSLSGVGGVLRPGIVHRIDKDTSGLLIVAKNDFAHQRLAAQIKAHTFTREYIAVLVGSLKAPIGTVDRPVGRSATDRKRMAVDAPVSRPAVTHYESIRSYQGYEYVRCRLETGRTHQIRVHMASIGHPVLGDTVYGGDRTGRILFPGLRGQCLHACRIVFCHPRNGRTLDFESPPPPYFSEVLTKLEKTV